MMSENFIHETPVVGLTALVFERTAVIDLITRVVSERTAVIDLRT
jgi:hypothetical protein